MSIDKSSPPLEYRSKILETHLYIHRGKAVSYLPMNTIRHTLGLEVHEYVAMIEERGHRAIVFGPQECCIKSGAVYAYSCIDLDRILCDSKETLCSYGWPVTADEFIKKIAAEWYDQDSDLCKVIRDAFGDYGLDDKR